MICKKKEEKAFDGSLTLEAAVVLPLFMLALISIISLMEMIKAYEDIEMNLYKAARTTALYYAGSEVSGAIEDGVATDIALIAVADVYAYSVMEKQMNEDYQSTNVIVDGYKGISLLQSGFALGSKEDSGGDIIDLVADYKMVPLCNFFLVQPYRMVNRCRVHAWTGFEGSGGSKEKLERIVYVAENGEVYHLSRSCTHIALSISATDKSSVDECRNAEGRKYTACDKCSFIDYDGSILFITSEGEKYHSSLSCSGLKRTITAIPISQVGDMKACSRCGG